MRPKHKLMTKKSETYHGRVITIEESGDSPIIRVDDGRLHVSKLEDQRYVTPYFPYEAFDNMEDLVHQVVDNWAYVAPIVRKNKVDKEEK